MTITIEGGITIQGGITVGNTSNSNSSGGSNGAVSFYEMTSVGSIQSWIESANTANINLNGFTLNSNVGSSGMYNGIAIANLTADNKTFFTTYGTGNKTATWAAGSSFTTMTVNLTTDTPGAGNGAPQLVFFMNSVNSFPATFVFPVTFT